MNSLTGSTLYKRRPAPRSGLLLALLIGGCSASLPQIAGPNTPEAPANASPLPAAEAGAPTSTAAIPPAKATPARVAAPSEGSSAPAAQRGGGTIVGFRGPTVILYGGERANDGERVAAASLSVPLPSRPSAANASRVEVMTVYGPRWIAKSEVMFAAPEAAANHPPQ